MTVVDWRELEPAVVDGLLAAEAFEYRARLAWDVGSAWAPIEQARIAGRLPGRAVVEPGGVSGWMCFLPHRQAVHVAMLVARDAATTRALLGSLLASDEARDADHLAMCVREPAAPGLAAALSAEAFDAVPYRYLARPTGGRSGAGVRPWQMADYEQSAELIGRAYRASRDIRPFALNGSADDWRDYVATIVAGPGCGQFCPDSSFVTPALADPTDPSGVVLTTEIAPGIAHIAQVAVDPANQTRGLGRLLCQAALSAAAARGNHLMTLLVADSNARALALYASLGFTPRAAFLAGVRRQPRRSTSVACATGGASTRR